MYDLTFITPLPTIDGLLDLLVPFKINKREIESLYKKIAFAYSNEGRSYHNLSHIGHVLAAIQWIVDSENLTLSRDHQCALLLAGWFHDIVYDPNNNDNEEQSANWMKRELQALGIAKGIIHQTANLILATRNHIASPDDLPAKILLDADLSILSAPPEIYTRYAHAIRQEYYFVPEDDYRAGRQGVLERFLARPQIFKTPIAQKHLENSARKNLKEEIGLLKSGNPCPLSNPEQKQ